MSVGAIVIAAGALAVAAWLTGRLCSTTAWPQLVDHPNDRSLHAHPTPRTGGLAIWGAMVAGIAGFVLLDRTGLGSWPANRPVQMETVAWIAGMVALAGLVSFLDDRKSVPAAVRLAVHALAASGVAAGACLVVPAVTIPAIGTLSFGWMAAPVTVLFIVWMANLYNFMDGMDGLASGMTWLGFGFFSCIAGIGGHAFIFLASLLVSMSAAGFLVFNLPPARIFMGDVGSVPLGFLAGTLTVLGVHDGVFDLWAPVLIFSPFVVDATVTLFRRLLRGVKVWRAHREHYYQRLVLAGWSHRKTMLAEYALMLASGVTAMLYVNATEPIRFAILMFWLIGYVVLAWSVRAIEVKRKSELANA